MKIDSYILDTILEIQKDDSFTEEFKKFAFDSYPIMGLCNIYEEGTGKKIIKENVNIVISFIKDCIPLMREINKEIQDFDDEMLRNLILVLYIPTKENYLKEVN